MPLDSDLLEAFEVHSPEDIRSALNAGASATDLIKEQTPVEALIQGYLRSARFADCLKVLVAAGASMDPLMKALLLDDESALAELLSRDTALLERRLSFAAAFTTCRDVRPLHVCAEFNSVRCARLLVEQGADLNSAAGLDEKGFGGQTPLFHCVNSIHNYCRPMLELLLDAGADTGARLKGLVWGSGAPWETLILDVTPMSYAQCGLYSQFHRREVDVYSNLSLLFSKRYGQVLPLNNVPNRYLGS